MCLWSVLIYFRISDKKDKYSKARGGTSRVLDIACEHCGQHIAYYQKDGPGVLKRMYIDRFIDSIPSEKELKCKNCKKVLGIKIVYKKESRNAYRLFVGATTKKIVSKDSI